MISIKHVVAALALGTALLAAPGMANAKVVRNTAHKLTTRKHSATRLHRFKKSATRLHASKVKHSSLSAKHKKGITASTTGWKHHRGL